jgi:hypothetical protein
VSRRHADYDFFKTQASLTAANALRLASAPGQDLSNGEFSVVNTRLSRGFLMERVTFNLALITFPPRLEGAGAWRRAGRPRRTTPPVHRASQSK